MTRKAIGAIAGLALLLTLASAARADWREDLGTFRIGVVAAPGAGAVIEGAAAIRAAYGKALGMTVELFVARDYAALIDAQAASRIEYAIHTAASYATAWRTCSCVEPIAAPVSADGATGIRSILVAHAGDLSVDALAKRRVASGPPDSASGYLVPLAEFEPGGKPMTGDEGWLVRVASESEAERLFLDGKVDAMFGFVPSSGTPAGPAGGTLERLAMAGGGEFRVLWTSGLLRFGPHAVRASLPAEAKDALKTFLTTLRDAEPEIYELIERHRGGGFAPVVHADYQEAIGMVRSLAARR